MQFSANAVLSGAEIAAVHEESIRILEQVGIAVYSQRAMKLLREGGAVTDETTRIVRIPASMAQEALSTVPGTIRIYDWGRTLAFTLGAGPCRHGTGFDELNVPQPDREWRKLLKRDVKDFSIVADQLDNVDFVGPQGMPSDVPQASSILHGVQAVLENTRKPLYFAVDQAATLRAVLEMASAVIGSSELGSTPPLVVQISPSSPLCWTEGAADSLVEAAIRGIPVMCLPQPMAAASAPMTLAGELAIGNAEFLSCCLIAQLARRGAPVIYGAAWTALNMHYGNAIFATPEMMLLRVAGIQMAKHYHVLSHAQGLNSDSAVDDQQTAWEKAFTASSAVLAGADLIVGGGAFGTAMASSYEQLILDNEVMGMIRRMRAGIDVSEHTLAFDLIRDVGPQGNFLSELHTLQTLRTPEFFKTAVSNKEPYHIWIEKGRPTVTETARKIAASILAKQRPRNLDDGITRRITEIIADYEHGRYKAE